MSSIRRGETLPTPLTGARQLSASTAKPAWRVTARTRNEGWFIEAMSWLRVEKQKSRATDVQSDARCIDQVARHAGA
jgi:hypothetical protein